MKRTRTLVIGVLAGLFSCTPKRNASLASREMLVTQLVNEGEPVRMSLLSPESIGLVKETYENLVTKNFVRVEENAPSLDLSRTVYEALTFAAKYGNVVTPDGGSNGRVIRQDVFHITADLANLSIPRPGASEPLALPFTFSRGGKIIAARVYPNEQAARKAPPIPFSNLPLSAEAARTLKPGDYFGLPVNTKVMAQVSSNFLQKSWSLAPALIPFFQNSFSGALSGIKQGDLMAQGTFELHLLRLDGDKVRARLTAGDGSKISAGLNLSASAAAQYVFVPATRLSKLRGFTQIKGWPSATKLISHARAALGVFKLVLPPVLRVFGQGNQAAGDVKGAADEERRFESVEKFLNLAEQVNLTMEEIDSKTVGRVNRVIGTVENHTVNRVNGFIEGIQKYTDKTLNLAGTVDVGTHFGHRVNVVADFVFDLSDAEARIAYDRMVSGRVMMQTKGAVVPRWETKNALYADATMAEDLAQADHGKPKRRVERMARVHDNYREHAGILNFQLAGVGRNFQRSWRRNEVEIIAGPGQSLNYVLTSRHFSTTGNSLGYETGETKTNGFVSPAGAQSNPSDVGSYFYNWSYDFDKFHRTPVATGLTEVVNRLGPVGAALGIANLFQGEHEGKVRVEMQVNLLPQGMRSLFDPTRTHEELLWRSLGAMASTFRNVDDYNIALLPKIDAFFFRSPSAFTGEGAQRAIDVACPVVQREWGKFYCGYFQDHFVRELLALQRSSTVSERLAFFDRFYNQGFLANRFGGDILVRFLAQLSHERDSKQASSDFSVRVLVKNADNTAESANPHLEHNQQPLSEIVESMGSTL